jgi:hypothetical protein
MRIIGIKMNLRSALERDLKSFPFLSAEIRPPLVLYFSEAGVINLCLSSISIY